MQPFSLPHENIWKPYGFLFSGGRERVHWEQMDQNVFLIPCLSTWWHHEILNSEILVFEYLKKEKNFWSALKNIFPSFKSALF